MGKSIKIALITPNLEVYSETFIHSHIEHIKYEKDVFYGGSVPEFHTNDGHIIDRTIFSWLLKWYLRIFKKLEYAEVKAIFLARKLKKLKSSVVFAEYGPTGAEMTPLCKRLKLPLIVHFHGDDAFNTKILKIYQLKYLELFDYASSIIVVSKDMKEQLIGLGASSEKIILNPYGPQEIFFDNKPNLNSNQFLSIGRFVEKKNPFLVVLGFKELNKEFPVSNLTYVGDGPLLNAVIGFSKAIGVSKKINFTGSLKRSEILDHMSNSFCYIQYSTKARDGSSEGTPVAILEASASGLPVVSTLHAGIKESVVNGETGLLSPELDLGMFIENLKYMYVNRSEAQEMGIRGKKFIRKNYSLQRHIGILEKAIFDTIK